MRSPSENFNLPIIGVIKTTPLTMKMTNSTSEQVQETIINSDYYEIIEKFDTFYVCNHWYDYSKNKPLLISTSLVEELIIIRK